MDQRALQNGNFLWIPGLLQPALIRFGQPPLPVVIQEGVHGPQRGASLVRLQLPAAPGQILHGLDGAAGVPEGVHHHAHSALGHTPVELDHVWVVARDVPALAAHAEQGLLLQLLGLALADGALEAGDQHHLSRPRQHSPRQSAPLKGGLGKEFQRDCAARQDAPAFLAAYPPRLERLLFRQSCRLQPPLLLRESAAPLFSQGGGVPPPDPVKGHLELLGHMGQGIPVLKGLPSGGPRQLQLHRPAGGWPRLQMFSPGNLCAHLSPPSTGPAVAPRSAPLVPLSFFVCFRLL